MAAAASEQDEANPVFRLATRAGKMDLLYLARSGFPALFPQKRNSLVQSFGHILDKSFFDQACSVKMA